jgi:hypothetical protein
VGVSIISDVCLFAWTRETECPVTEDPLEVAKIWKGSSTIFYSEEFRDG